jgi:hypothetical protein
MHQYPFFSSRTWLSMVLITLHGSWDVNLFANMTFDQKVNGLQVITSLSRERIINYLTKMLIMFNKLSFSISFAFNMSMFQMLGIFIFSFLFSQILYFFTPGNQTSASPMTCSTIVSVVPSWMVPNTFVSQVTNNPRRRSRMFVTHTRPIIFWLQCTGSRNCKDCDLYMDPFQNIN